MAAVTLNIIQNTIPGITSNDLKYVVYKAVDYPAETASQTFAPPHNERTISFPGLERTNYIWKLFKMSGMTIVEQLESFQVVPDNDGVIYKSPELIQVDITPGFTAGATVAVLDGSSGTEDWRGFEIYVERLGIGTMKKGLDYTWNINTGTFTLIVIGDSFQHLEFYNITFGLIVGGSSGIIAPSTFGGQKIITNTDSLSAGDVGKDIIIKGAAPYFEVQLPDVTTVPSGKVYFIEGGVGSHKCVRFKTQSGQTIDFLKGARTDVKVGVSESFWLYREAGASQWRIKSAVGNFAQVGRIITTDADITDEFNVLELNGATVSVTEYARLYEDYVTQLDSAQVVTFANWSVGNNKYKWSLASGGVFHVPDRRNVYSRNWDGTILPGVFQDWQFPDHKHEESIGTLPATLFGRGASRIPGGYNSSNHTQTDLTSGIVDMSGNPIPSNVGLDVRPVTVVERKFVLV